MKFPDKATVDRLKAPGVQVLSASNQASLGTTPWKVERDKDAGPLQLLSRLPGYVEQKMMLSGQSDETRRVTMIAEPAPPPVPAKPAENVKKNGSGRRSSGGKSGKSSGNESKGSGGDSIDVPIVR